MHINFIYVYQECSDRIISSCCCCCCCFYSKRRPFNFVVFHIIMVNLMSDHCVKWCYHKCECGACLPCHSHNSTNHSTPAHTHTTKHEYTRMPYGIVCNKRRVYSSTLELSSEHSSVQKWIAFKWLCFYVHATCSAFVAQFCDESCLVQIVTFELFADWHFVWRPQPHYNYAWRIHRCVYVWNMKRLYGLKHLYICICKLFSLKTGFPLQNQHHLHKFEPLFYMGRMCMCVCVHAQKIKLDQFCCCHTISPLYHL